MGHPDNILGVRPVQGLLPKVFKCGLRILESKAAYYYRNGLSKALGLWATEEARKSQLEYHRCCLKPF